VTCRPRHWSLALVGPGGVRREGGASPFCGSCTERGKAGADTATACCEAWGDERERVVRRNPETLSTVAASAGGPARSSGEAPVMGVERRAGSSMDLFARATGTERFWEETSGQARSG
jgi:hypothetical protein